MRAEFRDSRNRKFYCLNINVVSWQVCLSFIHVLDINEKNKVTAPDSEITTGCEKGCLDVKIIELHETMRMERALPLEY